MKITKKFIFYDSHTQIIRNLEMNCKSNENFSSSSSSSCFMKFKKSPPPNKLPLTICVLLHATFILFRDGKKEQKNQNQDAIKLNSNVIKYSRKFLFFCFVEKRYLKQMKNSIWTRNCILFLDIQRELNLSLIFFSKKKYRFCFENLPTCSRKFCQFFLWLLFFLQNRKIFIEKIMEMENSTNFFSLETEVKHLNFIVSKIYSNYSTFLLLIYFADFIKYLQLFTDA